MEVVSVAYSRINLLDETCDSEYQYEANRMAFDIYEKVIAAVPDIKRVDVVISNEHWPDYSKKMNVIRFEFDNRVAFFMQVDDCLIGGAAAAANPIIQHLKARLNKVKQEGSLNGGFR